MITYAELSNYAVIPQVLAVAQRRRSPVRCARVFNLQVQSIRTKVLRPVSQTVCVVFLWFAKVPAAHKVYLSDVSAQTNVHDVLYKLFWWGSIQDITDRTVIRTTSWSWHLHKPAPVVRKTKPQGICYKDASLIKLQQKVYNLLAFLWRPNATTASRSWRRRLHSSPNQPWSCILWVSRRRRRSRRATRTPW